VEVKTCPACKSTRAETVGSEVPGFSAIARGAEFVQEQYAVRECADCGLLYKSRTLSPPEFADYYSRVDFRKWETTKFYPTEREVLRKLRALPAGARILDFGCSSGRLLAPLVGTHRCFGHEVNEGAIRQARAKRINILSLDDLASEATESYDAVVMVDVFEHLQTPVDTLDKLIRLLRMGGYFIVVTGDGDGATCRLDPAQFWYFRIVEHVAMLTRNHASWLERQFMLTLSDWQSISHYKWDPKTAIGQRLRHFAYWQFRSGTKLMQALLRRLPMFRRAERWPVAPPFWYSADHVVAVFKKL
jgi:SAM-dependent methyltransferase